MLMRDAEERDVPVLAGMLLACTGGLVGYLYGPDGVAGRFLRAGTCGHFCNSLVVEEEARIIGFGHAYPYRRALAEMPDPAVPQERWALVAGLRHVTVPESLYLSGLYVDAAYRRRGIGSALVARLADRAEQEPCLSLHVFTANTGAIRFYEMLGFACVGRVLLPATDALTSGREIRCYRRDLSRRSARPCEPGSRPA